MKKILIVDDEIAYSTLLKDKLSSTYTVLTSPDGQHGLELALKEQPDLLLLDISMPIMDGMTMLGELRKDTYGKKAKVIMLTNLEPTETIVKEAVDEQPIFYVIKSQTTLDELLKKIHEALGDAT